MWGAQLSVGSTVGSSNVAGSTVGESISIHVDTYYYMSIHDS
jgi:hypothetical protein